MIYALLSDYSVLSPTSLFRVVDNTSMVLGYRPRCKNIQYTGMALVDFMQIFFVKPTKNC